MTETNRPAPMPEADTLHDYILAKIDSIADNTTYLKDAAARLGDMNAAGPGDIAGQAKAQALGDIVRCRETTNQRLIELLSKMYEDTRPPRNERAAALEALASMAQNDDFTSGLDDIRHILNLF